MRLRLSRRRSKVDASGLCTEQGAEALELEVIPDHVHLHT
jgi:REP element-mobilizing transposase RayT